MPDFDCKPGHSRAHPEREQGGPWQPAPERETLGTVRLTPQPNLPATPDTFRSLARSSPWLWERVEFVWTERQDGASHVLRCTVTRPDEAVATDEDGHVTRARDELGRGRAWISFGDGAGGQPPFRWASDTAPVLDGHGLVARRPQDFAVQRDAPMIGNYRFVALLDPLELADGQNRDDDAEEVLVDGVALASVHEAERHGRRTWWATATPLAGYDPRCSCCALLPGEVSERLLAEESGGGPVPEGRDDGREFLVALDVQTGICVSVTALDGRYAGDGFDVEILSAG